MSMVARGALTHMSEAPVDGPGRNTHLWRCGTPDLSPSHVSENLVIVSIQTVLICTLKIGCVAPDFRYQFIAGIVF